MKKTLNKILSPRNKGFLEDFDKTDFGDYPSVSNIKKINFSLRKQDQVVTLRVSAELLALLKKAAAKQKTKYQKLVRLILEKNITTYA